MYYIALTLFLCLAEAFFILLYRVFIKYCVFFRIFKNIPDFGLSLFSLGVSVYVYTHQAGRKPALQHNWQSLEKSKF